MQQTATIWFLILLALTGANLPILNQRLFALTPSPLHTAKKSFWLRLRLLEMICCYFLLGAVGYLLASRAGNVFPKDWEFYTIGACLMLVFAFPGFAFQYLRRQ